MAPEVAGERRDPPLYTSRLAVRSCDSPRRALISTRRRREGRWSTWPGFMAAADSPAAPGVCTAAALAMSSRSRLRRSPFGLSDAIVLNLAEIYAGSAGSYAFRLYLNIYNLPAHYVTNSYEYLAERARGKLE